MPLPPELPDDDFSLSEEQYRRLPKTFNLAVLRALKADPEMPETCAQWRRDEPDPERRIIRFAFQLHADVARLLRGVATSWGPDATEFDLLMNLALLVETRLNFTRIARKLLHDFAPPEPPCRCGECRQFRPMEWLSPSAS